eukprot:TRINITY_DN67384_c6_g4_i1.p1 TRINITY_DN67384_c6_g4~~TRINITY_DN67384_c6_g4_i1.p1  ORF type:complete len:552 (-),score=78.90 TRINITY_DN67384_c6_g4_i1:788-2419(-)
MVAFGKGKPRGRRTQQPILTSLPLHTALVEHNVPVTFNGSAGATQTVDCGTLPVDRLVEGYFDISPPPTSKAQLKQYKLRPTDGPSFVTVGVKGGEEFNGTTDTQDLWQGDEVVIKNEDSQSVIPHSAIAYIKTAVPQKVEALLKFTEDENAATAMALRFGLIGVQWKSTVSVVVDLNTAAVLRLSAECTITNKSNLPLLDARAQLFAQQCEKQGLPKVRSSGTKFLSSMTSFSSGGYSSDEDYYSGNHSDPPPEPAALLSITTNISKNPRTPAGREEDEESLLVVNGFDFGNSQSCSFQYLACGGLPCNTRLFCPHSPPPHGSVGDEMYRGGFVSSTAKAVFQLTIANGKEHGLGKWIPPSTILCCSKDGKSANTPMKFMSTGSIDAVPVGGDIRLSLYEEKTLEVTRSQKHVKKDENKGTLVETIEVSIQNSDGYTKEVIVEELMFRWSNWTITQSSHPHTPHHNGNDIVLFTVKVPAAEKPTVLSYTVQYSWNAGGEARMEDVVADGDDETTEGGPTKERQKGRYKMKMGSWGWGSRGGD